MGQVASSSQPSYAAMGLAGVLESQRGSRAYHPERPKAGGTSVGLPQTVGSTAHSTGAHLLPKGAWQNEQSSHIDPAQTCRAGWVQGRSSREGGENWGPGSLSFKQPSAKSL